MTIKNNFEDHVANFIKQHGLFSCQHLFVGFSGGADSTALLVVLQKLLPANKKLTAIHFQHGIREKSADDDARWCKDFCGVRKIDFHCEYLQVPSKQQKGENLEAAARRLRLAYWQKVATNDCYAVALGHHQGDRQEELLMRLLRGVNSSGLTPIRAERELCGVRIIRPLLSVSKDDIIDYLKYCGVRNWCQDPTNKDCSLRRNAARHQWLPMLKKSIGHLKGLQHTLNALEDDARYLEEQAQDFVKKMVNPCELRKLSSALFPRGVRIWLSAELGYDIIISHASLKRLRQDLLRTSQTECKITIGKGITLLHSHDQLQLLKESKTITPLIWNWQKSSTITTTNGHIFHAEIIDGKMEIPKEENCECFALDSMPEKLMIRIRQAGDTLLPFAANSAKKLKKLFNDAHLPAHLREQWPLLCNPSGMIIWVPKVKRAEFARIEKNQSILRISHKS